MSPADVKNTPFVVSADEVDYFKKNYPIHHAVLEKLISTGKVRIEESAKVS